MKFGYTKTQTAMKTIPLNPFSPSSLSDELAFEEESDGLFDDNWIVSANDLFGTFTAMNEAMDDSLMYYGQAA